MTPGSALRHGCAGASLVLLLSSVAYAGSHLWRFSEFYSSPDRSVQFIEMHEIGGSDIETAISNHWYETNSYNHDHSDLLDSDLPFGTANKKFLVGTQSYAALSGVPAPDYVVPDGIINPAGDTVIWWFYQTIDIPPGAMPSDGINSITVVDPNVPTYSMGTNSPTNFAGETGTVVLGSPVPTVTPTPVPPFACAPTPLPGCKAPVESQKSQMLIKNDPETDDVRDAIRWLWRKGAATTFAELGDPTSTTDYAFCLYDESAAPTLLFPARAPAGGTCGTAPCWRGLGDPPGTKGYKRTDNTLQTYGLQRLQLTPGAAGKAKIMLKGKGANLTDLPTLPLDLPVRAQLQARNGTCWEAVYSTSSKNDLERFKAKAD
jgi:hypothetical protein